LREEIHAAGLDGGISQFFTVLTGAMSVGIKEGKRAYNHVVCLRAVTTNDFMAADWVRIPYDIVACISARITAEVPQVCRVVLDVTDKPPAAIEWE
jgi:GMP synthase (glutamine-hydrolysing)